MAILRCTESFAGEIEGVPFVVTAGTIVDSSDARCGKRYRYLFEDVADSVDRFIVKPAEGAPVEQATAAPGEKRTTPVRPTAQPTATAGGTASNATVKTSGPKPK